MRTGVLSIKELREKAKEEYRLWICYREIYIRSKEEARRQIVDTYLTFGNMSQVAILWHTSRNVVCKWVRRFERKGDEGFRDKSRRPHSSPHKVSNNIEQKVLEAIKNNEPMVGLPRWRKEEEEASGQTPIVCGSKAKAML